METTYENLVKKWPELKGVLSKTSWDYISVSNKDTLKLLRKDWIKNIRKNIRSGLYKKHGPLVKDCVNIAKNKAVIAVGAGPSFNKNKKVLKRIHDEDGCKEWRDRDFVIIASNHQYKPLLKMGIIPDFVVAVDASDVIYKQMCESVPKIGKHTVFFAGLQMSSKVFDEWDRQGRDIRFYLPATKGLDKAFEKYSGNSAAPLKINVGGNVLNSAWVISKYFLGSSVFFAVGCDLSYPRLESIDERRKAYYADGDYSTNAKLTGTGRDEAKNRKDWMAFSIEKNRIIRPTSDVRALKGTYRIEIDLAHTTNTLWVYKTWIEAQVMFNYLSGQRFHYFNCSEGGIAGVMCKDETIEGRFEESNWFLLDDACPRWHTMMLEDAANYFVECKRRYESWEHQRKSVVAPYATGLVQPA